MKVIELTIPIEPVAKARSRTALRNGKVRSYTPERTQIAQDFIKTFLQPYKDQCFPIHVPIKLTATFFRHKSVWLPRREKMPFRKSDLDNYAKLVCDCLNGILIPDDAQLTSMDIKKRWSPNGEGYIIIKLEEDIE